MISVIPAGLEPATYGLGKPINNDVSQNVVNASNHLCDWYTQESAISCRYPQPGCSTVAKQQFIASLLTEVHDHWANSGDVTVLRRRLLEVLLYLDY
jgi:hypothetical protein